MKHGFICFSKTGRMQVDSTNIALGLIRKQVFNCPRRQTSGQGVIDDVPFPIRVHDRTRMIAAKSNFWVRIGGQALKSANNNAYVSLPFSNVPSGQITVWEFGDAPVNHRHQKMGVVVKNPQTGETVYNSNWGVVDILHVQTINIQPTGGWSMTLPNNGQDVAVVVGGGSQVRVDQDEYMEWSSLYWRINGSKLEIQSFVERFARPYSGFYGSSCQIPIFLIIVNVAGL